MRAIDRLNHGRKPIPLTVIGGIPQAGKTSLIRHLLNTSSHKRLTAVVSSLDPLLDEAVDARRDGNRLQWASGNLAIATDDTTETLSSLTGESQCPDHVIVEANTAGSPLRRAGYAYMPGYKPDGMVTVVDATQGSESGPAGCELSDTARQQLLACDLVVLNKLDLAGSRAAFALQRTISHFARSARFMWCTQGRVSPLLALGPQDTGSVPEEASIVAAWRSDFEPLARGRKQPFNGESCHSWCLVSEAPLSTQEFRAWANSLPGTVMRGSGPVFLRESPRTRHEFSLVGKRWHLASDAVWEAGAPVTRISLVTVGGQKERVIQ